MRRIVALLRRIRLGAPARQEQQQVSPLRLTRHACEPSVEMTIHEGRRGVQHHPCAMGLRMNGAPGPRDVLSGQERCVHPTHAR